MAPPPPPPPPPPPLSSHLSLADDADDQYDWEIKEYKKYSKSTTSLTLEDGDGDGNGDEIEQIIQNSSNHQLRFYREESTEWDVIISLIKGSIGSGIMTVPFAFERLGILFGVFVVIIGMIVNCSSVYILSYTCRMTSLFYSGDLDPFMITEYVQLSKLFQDSFPLSEWITFFLLFILLISPIICGIQENILLYKNIVSAITRDYINPSSFGMGLFISIVIFFPMTMVTSPKGLIRNNRVAIFAMLYIFLLLLIDFWFNDSLLKRGKDDINFLYNGKSSVLEKISSIIAIFYSLSNHLVAPHLLSFLPSKEGRMGGGGDDLQIRKVLAKSSSLTASFYLFIGILGSFIFPQIGKAFIDKKTSPYLIGQFMFSLLNITSIPMLMVPIPLLIKEFHSDTNWIFLNGFYSIGCGFILSLIFSNDSSIIDVVGSLCGGPLFFIIPAYYYNSMINEMKPLERGKWIKRVITLMTCIGSIFLIIGVYFLMIFFFMLVTI